VRCALVAFGNEESYGLLFVGGELLRLGQEIRFFDAEMGDVAAPVAAWRPDFVLFSPLTAFFPAARRVGAAIKELLPGVTVVHGGHHAAACPGIAELPGIDLVVVGPVRGAAERMLAGERGLIRTAPTVPGDLPAPARRELYRDVPRMASRYRKIMVSMLGCPWSCTYCGSAAGRLQGLFGAAAHRRYFLRRRPVAAVLAEARAIAAHETAEIEWVDDDVFAGPEAAAWLAEFAGAWRREIGLPLYVSTTSRSALRIPDATLRALQGIVRCVGMGVQAVRPESLALLGRPWDDEARMKAAYDRLASFGFAVNLQGIVGLPVDDPVEDALATVRGLQRIGPGSVVSLYPLQIYPGTALEALCDARGLERNPAATGDTNTGVPALRFTPTVERRIRNICKLATLFVKHGVEEAWIRALIDVDFDEATSRALSLARYRDCVVDRLGARGEELFAGIVAGMNLRY
jgi:radical SAM superfamily enzyme YgiQ (UPF0313 family)